MSERVGGLRVIATDSVPAAVATIAKSIKLELTRFSGRYAYWILVDDAHRELFLAELVRRCGKKRVAGLSVFSTVDAFYSGLPPQHRAPARVRDRVAAECRELMDAAHQEIYPGLSLDYLVADRPNAPISQAYCAGLRSLGFQAPFSDLGARTLPVTVQSVYHPIADPLPQRVVAWLLEQSLRGVSVTLGCQDPAQIMRLVPDSAQAIVEDNRTSAASSRRPEHQRTVTYASSEDRIDALSSMAVQDHVAYIRFDAFEDMVAFEMRCLESGLAISPSKSSGLVYRPEFQAVSAYADWVSSESKAGFYALFAMAGGSEQRWRRTAGVRHLPGDPAVAVRQPHRLQDDSIDAGLLRRMSDLLLAARFAESARDSLSAFVDWANDEIPFLDESMTRLLMHHLCEGGRSLRNISELIHDFTTLSGRGPVIYGPSDPPAESAVGGVRVADARTWSTTAFTYPPRNEIMLGLNHNAEV